MARVGARHVPRTESIWVIQQNWGYGHGWEDVGAYSADQFSDARRDLRAYRMNQGNIPARMISRRVDRVTQEPPGRNRTRSRRTRHRLGPQIKL